MFFDFMFLRFSKIGVFSTFVGDFVIFVRYLRLIFYIVLNRYLVIFIVISIFAGILLLFFVFFFICDFSHIGVFFNLGFFRIIRVFLWVFISKKYLPEYQWVEVEEIPDSNGTKYV